MIAKIDAWTQSNGAPKLKCNKNGETTCRVERVCSKDSNACGFKIVANSPKKGASFRINEVKCIWEHSDTCQQSSRTRSISLRDTVNTNAPIVKAIRQHSDAQKCLNALGEGQHVYELFSQHNYDLSGDPKNVKQAMRRFIRRVFNVDERGLCEALGQLPGLCDAFNKTPGNGHADLIIVDGVFMGLTIVFDSAVHATMHCGARVFCIDACHLIYERNDLRLGLIEGTLSTNKILPVVVHLGWQESFEFYRDMFTSVQTHRPIFFSHLDSIETCLIGDRHGGLKKAVKVCFAVSNKARATRPCGRHTHTTDVPHLRSCRGHIKSNVRAKTSITSKLCFSIWCEQVWCHAALDGFPLSV